jgi:alcohol dehydrogenase (cytochrome c)
MNARLFAMFVPSLVSFLVASGSAAQSVAPDFKGTALMAPRTDWATNGGDWYNRRYSPLKEINHDTVERLKGVWRARLNGSGFGPKYSAEAQPLYFDGVLYVSTPANDVFAIDVDTGKFLWTYEAHLEDVISTVCCGWTNRGVAIGGGKVFAGQLDGKLVALDQRTGKVEWSIQAERWQDGYTITTAPLYYDDLVITGFAGAEFGVRGRVKAYDAKSGKLVWTFYTIPGPGEFGHDTWPQDNEVWRSGGGTVWNTPALDPELGLLYFSTGNAGPDFNGGVRPGDNLFSASIVAVDVRTGQYRWHFQEVHHDLWDYDAPNPVVLFDVNIGGVPRKGVAQAGKTGWLYLLDRTNGKPLIGIEERPVPQEPRQATAATQPFPVGDAFVPLTMEVAPEGFTLVNQGGIFTPYWTDYVVAKPGLRGGANWPPSSLDIETDYLYVCAADSASAFRAWDIEEKLPPPGEFYIGGNFGTNPIPVFGIFAAMDLKTNKLVWQQHWPERCLSGSVATAGGLVFVGRSDGRFTALDSATGTKRWEFQTGAGVNAPATVFEHKGREYVAVVSGGHVQGGPHGDSVWLFSLGGTLGPVAPAAQAPAAQTTSAVEAPVSLDAGKTAFANSCVFCHGADGTGGHGGPAFTTALSEADIRRTVAGGRNQMPAFGTFLNDAAIANLSAWVLELARRNEGKPASAPRGGE